MTTPRIYVADLAAYNAGILRGKWIDASQDAEDIQREIDALLLRSPESNVTRCSKCFTTRLHYHESPATGPFESFACPKGGNHDPAPSAEEFAIHDHEGFPDGTVGEYTSIEDVSTLAKLLEDHDADVVKAVLDNGTKLEDAEEEIQDKYQGTFRTLEDWAEQFLDDTGAFAQADDMLKSYFDYERWARDAEMSGDIWTAEGGDGVLVFHS
jgi:antirestriction protein